MEIQPKVKSDELTTTQIFKSSLRLINIHKAIHNMTRDEAIEDMFKKANPNYREI